MRAILNIREIDRLDILTILIITVDDWRREIVKH